MLNTNTRALFHIAVACCYLLFLLVATYYKARRPSYNWDMLPYMALVVSVEQEEPFAIHATTYNSAKRGVPEPTYEALTHSNDHYRDRALSDANFFYGQLPFYAVKPLYVGLSFLFYKLGCSLVTAVFLPSVLSYFGIGLLIFLWLRRHLYIVMAAIVSGFIMLSAPLLYVSSVAVPDCLSALVLLCSFYFLIEKKSLLWGYILLLLSIAVRIDNVLVALFVVSFLVFGKKWQHALGWNRFLLMLGGISVVYLVVASGAALYGWSPLFFPSFFVKHQEYFPQASASASWREFLHLRQSAIMMSMKFMYLFVYLGFSMLLFVTPRPLRWSSLSFSQGLMAVLVVFLAVRALIYTDLSDRHFVGYFVLIAVLLAIRVSELARAQGGSSYAGNSV